MAIDELVRHQSEAISFNQGLEELAEPYRNIEGFPIDPGILELVSVDNLRAEAFGEGDRPYVLRYKGHRSLDPLDTEGSLVSVVLQPELGANFPNKVKSYADGVRTNIRRDVHKSVGVITDAAKLEVDERVHGALTKVSDKLTENLTKVIEPNQKLAGFVLAAACVPDAVMGERQGVHTMIRSVARGLYTLVGVNSIRLGEWDQQTWEAALRAMQMGLFFDEEYRQQLLATNYEYWRRVGNLFVDRVALLERRITFVELQIEKAATLKQPDEPSKE